MLWRYLARPLLFLLPAESAHHVSMSAFHGSMQWPLDGLVKNFFHIRDPALEMNLFGLEFENPVGLAAGFDKQARWFNSLYCLGFSHVEVGTVTGESQAGNPRPRLFRLTADQALVNRMGFNNFGAENIADSLKNKRIHPVLGINIGKTKLVANEDAEEDYLQSFRLLFPFARYFTINVSSPNTPGLRQLQDRKPLHSLLSSLMKLNRAMASETQSTSKPILLKISPDLSQSQLSDIVAIAFETDIAGIVATNTSTARNGLRTRSQSVSKIGEGGLSGAPLRMRSRAIVRQLHQQTGGRLPIIGVGGIMNGEDAWQMICAGASLIQVYTGFVYGGPSFVRSINRYLLTMLREHRFDSIAQAVGISADGAGSSTSPRSHH